MIFNKFTLINVLNEKLTATKRDESDIWDFHAEDGTRRVALHREDVEWGIKMYWKSIKEVVEGTMIGSHKVPFVVANKASGAIYYINEAKSDKEMLVNVSWKEHSSFEAGEIDMYQPAVETHIRNGAWQVIDQAVVSRVEYFQVHIDAVQENLDSLKKGFEQLKKDVLKGSI